MRSRRWRKEAKEREHTIRESKNGKNELDVSFADFMKMGEVEKAEIIRFAGNVIGNKNFRRRNNEYYERECKRS